MMTTALKSLYVQIEMPNDQPYRSASTRTELAWKVDYSGNAIPLEQTLDPTSPNYMVFDDQLPVNAARLPSCGMSDLSGHGAAWSTRSPATRSCSSACSATRRASRSRRRRPAGSTRPSRFHGDRSVGLGVGHRARAEHR